MVGLARVVGAERPRVLVDGHRVRHTLCRALVLRLRRAEAAIDIAVYVVAAFSGVSFPLVVLPIPLQVFGIRRLPESLARVFPGDLSRADQAG